MSRSLRDWAVPISSRGLASAAPENEEVSRSKKVAERLGIPWPPPKLAKGRPSRRVTWQRLLYSLIRSSTTIPDWVTAEPPAAWEPGQDWAKFAPQDSGEEEGVNMGGEEAHEGQEDGSEGDAPEAKRRYYMVDTVAKGWS